MSSRLAIALQSFLNGVPTKLIDPNTGKEMEDVTLLPNDSKKK
jgi:hypothetical protein